MPPRLLHDDPHSVAVDRLAHLAPLLGRWIERLLGAHDPPLTVAQLLALEAVDEGVVGRRLAERASVSPAAVSQLLAALERAGLVERLPAVDDRRRLALGLTPEGRRTLRSARRALREGLRPLVTVLRRREAESLAAALDRLAPGVSGTPPPPRSPRPRPPGPRRPSPR
jgi:DNA-binding MarR family transcriptional regulator